MKREHVNGCAAETAATTAGFPQVQRFLYDAAQLLGYPDAAWRANLDAVADDASALAADDAEAVRALVDEARAADPLEFEAAYVETFDLGTGANLYLASGEGKEVSDRSMDMLAFSLYYQESGFELEQESPDYLPALLELASAVGEAEAQRIVRGCGQGLSAVQTELVKAQRGAYAAVVERVRRYAQMYESEVAA